MKNKVIGVFSAKGGVGKTTTSINIAAALNQFGRTALVIDTDITSPNLGMYLGNFNIPNSLHKVLKGNVDIKNAVYIHDSGIHVIVGSINPHDVDKIDYKKINEEISKLKDNYEILLIDSAPGRYEETLAEMDIITSILIITTPELASVTDALRTITIAKEFKKEILGVVVTRAGNHEHEMTPDNISAMLGVPVIAVIPEDKNIPLSAKVSSPILQSHPESDASYAYKQLTASLLGETYKKIEVKRNDDSMFKYMMKNLGLE